MNGVKKKRKRVNHANKFAIILSTALIINLFFYWLPDSMLGVPVKKVDLLSEVRILPDVDNGYLLALSEDDFDDGLIEKFDSNTETSQVFTSSKPKIQETDSNKGVSSTAQELNNASTEIAGATSNTTGTTSNTTINDKSNTDYLVNTNIEDFTSEHTGLRRFFAALNNINNLGRPVRIAFVGDSFIEGDILVADFRAKMQEYFGGKGIGFIPITSNVAQFRPTIKQSARDRKNVV